MATGFHVMQGFRLDSSEHSLLFNSVWRWCRCTWNCKRVLMPRWVGVQRTRLHFWRLLPLHCFTLSVSLRRRPTLRILIATSAKMLSWRNAFPWILWQMISLRLQRMEFCCGNFILDILWWTDYSRGDLLLHLLMYLMEWLFFDAANLSMWLFRGQLMNGLSIPREYLIHGKGMKTIISALILRRLLDVLLSTLERRTWLKGG